MFPKSANKPALIGEPFRSKEAFTMYDSKIGGLPIWLTKSPDQYPFMCKQCKKEMCLVSQIYNPTEYLDRVIYVFCCLNSKCQLSSDGWHCIRQQVEAPEEDVSVVAPKLEAKKVSSVGSKLSWDLDTSSAATAFSLYQSFEKFGNPSVDTAHQIANKTSSNPAPSMKIPIGVPVTDQTRICVPELYLDIFEEPKKKRSQKNNYEVENSCDCEEEYETDKKMDSYVKFLTKISQNPKQVIRIAYPDGSPLIPKSLSLQPVERCDCGKKKIFEIQLLPTILSYLHMDEEDVALESLKDMKEWSMVLIYTCSCNCDVETEIVKVVSSM